MPITLEDYYRKGHIYLESAQGRNDIFGLFRKEIEEGLREGGKILNAVADIRVLEGYIKGDSFLFLDTDTPNVFRLRKKKEEIKQDALRFLKEIIDLVKKVYLTTRDVNHKFDLFYLLAKFMPEIPDLRMKHYADLYLLMFHTVMFLDRFEGKEKDVFDLGDLVIRAFGRYDCVNAGENFLRDIKLKELLKGYASKYAPYETYVARLKAAVKKLEISRDFNEEDMARLVFTDKLFYLLNDIHRVVASSFLGNSARISSYISSRCYELFDRENEEREMLVNEATGIIEQKIREIKVRSTKQSPSGIPYQTQEIKTL